MSRYYLVASYYDRYSKSYSNEVIIKEISMTTEPKYDEDVYSSNGKMIRKAGGDYDAHHIQPLGMNGQNEASNITPLHANEHYDKQGVHAPDSPYSKLDKMLWG